MKRVKLDNGITVIVSDEKAEKMGLTKKASSKTEKVATKKK